MMPNFANFAASLALLAGINACSAESASEPGLCKLQCKNSVIAPNDYVIKKLNADLNIRCSTAGQIVNVTGGFAIYKKTTMGSSTREIPVPNVSIFPVVNGLVDQSVGEGPFKGVRTDENEFCTDSCGTATFEVAAQCPATGTSELLLNIRSGALAAPDQSFRVSLEMPDPDAQ